MDKCLCYSGLNTCCCKAPPGSFSQGFTKIPCIGGTYQDGEGQGKCRLCNSSGTMLYNLSSRGAVDLLDCAAALCQCSSGDSTCESQCATPQEVYSKMTSRPRSEAWCKTLGIPESSCTWTTPGSAWRSVQSTLWPFTLLAVLSMLRVLPNADLLQLCN